MASKFIQDPTKWDKETEARHIDVPYFKTRNMKKLSALVRSKRDRDVILEIADRIIFAVDPDVILMHGSRGDGTASMHSDVDLMVIFYGELQGDENMKIYDQLINCPIKVDFSLATKNDIMEWGCKESSLYHTAIKKGYHLYEKDDDAAVRMLKYAEDIIDYYPYRSIRRSIISCLVLEGKGVPKTKNLDEMCKMPSRSFKLTKYVKKLPYSSYNNVVGFDDYDSNDMDFIKVKNLARNVFKTVNSEFKRRGAL